jgi:tripartite-type tricarboxylate transporter receptor subunit TctC
VVIVSTSYAVNANLYRMPYDPVDQVTAIGLIGTAPFIVAVNPTVPAKSVKELVELARKNPGTLNYGSTGQGAITHLATELLNLMAGVRMTHIPYKGAGPALTDLLAGQLHLMLGSTLSTLPHVRSGKLRGIAVTSAARSPVVPEMPTVAESGVPGYECTLWYGVWGPPKLPEAVARRLSEELKRVLSSADFKDRLAQEGMVPAYLARPDFRAFLAGEVAKWGKVVKATGIKVE